MLNGIIVLKMKLLVDPWIVPQSKQASEVKLCVIHFRIMQAVQIYININLNGHRLQPHYCNVKQHIITPQHRIAINGRNWILNTSQIVNA